MKKTNERRLQKAAKRYKSLAEKDPIGFRNHWNRMLVQPYLEEIRHRAKPQRRTAKLPEIFEVYRRADRLLVTAGEAVEALVGSETRNLLAAECAKAVGAVYDRRLYRLVKKRLFLGTP
ncbi:MAG: hypothetical protein AB7Q37_03270 [Pyrinomonadaceae bacterium]